MSRFDTVVIVDWSAGQRSPKRPSKDAIWIGVSRFEQDEEPRYFRTRIEAETWITGFIQEERDAARRVLIGFDFPFGYPLGVAKAITGSGDPLSLWHWLEDRIRDDDLGRNNRFAVAEEMNRCFFGPGPFWGKPNETDWPDVPFRKAGIAYDQVAERRTSDRLAKAASSCFQLAFPPTVGSQVLMGLPMLARLRRKAGVAVWPFDEWSGAQTVLAEIWPGLIEEAVKSTTLDGDQTIIRDREQVRLLARAISRLPPQDLQNLMQDLPAEASEEAWILGIGHAKRLSKLAGETCDRLAPPQLRNDCFALPAGVDWTPVDQALALLKERLTPVTGVSTVQISETLGRVLAKDVVAARSNPPQANSAVDGYGFSGAVPEGSHTLPLIQGRAAAGLRFEGTVPAGQAIRILTGAALPDGVDTVILEEDVNTDGNQIAFRGPLKAGANARKAGEDMVEGKVAARVGRQVTPADLALLSAIGVSHVTVRDQLRVAVVSTGDELVDPGQHAAPGQIYDANRPMLLGMIKKFGFQAIDMGQVEDDRLALRAQLDAAAAKSDVILTSGGASAGDEDHVSALLTEAGAMQQWRIAVKPGRPLALGLWKGVPVFGLPGNPVAAMVCTLVFARPAMCVLGGMEWQQPQGFDLPAAFEKQKKPGRREYLRARVRDGKAEVFASEGSGRISGLSWAEGLVEIEDGERSIRFGDAVRFIPYGSFGL